MSQEFNACIVRYSEIGLKGRNRSFFENRLRNDIVRTLDGESGPPARVEVRRGRIYIENLTGPVDLARVFGVASFSPARRLPRDYEALRSTVKKTAGNMTGTPSFRVSCQRVDKSFPKTSVEVEREMGEIIFTGTGIPVNLTKPATNLQIEIGERGIYLFSEKIPGPGGLPCGTAGRAVALISGGIDSPVAVYLMMKRGIEPILIHFRIGEDDYRKVLKLKRQLEKYTAGRKLELLAPARAEIFQGRFKDFAGDARYSPFLCVACKYLMHRRAEELAEEHGALGIITGDNLAQVASQTLKNMAVTHGFHRLPVFSPLIAMEKVEIIQKAQAIGTYEISILPARDGCIPPRNPRTGVKAEGFREVMNHFGLPGGETGDTG